jgi:hypothetical protein
MGINKYKQHIISHILLAYKCTHNQNNLAIIFWRKGIDYEPKRYESEGCVGGLGRS